MMVAKVFLNDELVEAEQAHVSAADSGLLYGAGLFETLRSHQGIVFRLHDHLERLRHSAEALSIIHPYEEPYLREAIDKLLTANGLAEARLRLTLTNGALSEGQEQRKPTLLITATEFRPYPADYYRTGVLVTLCPFRQNATDPTAGHKTTCYYPRLLALNLAHQSRAAESIWFTADNRVAEGCVSNVFLVKKSVLYTPPVGTPVLPGIARKTVSELAARQSIEMAEKDLHITDVLEADEIFLTNVIMEVLPVNSVEQHTVGDGKVGPVTRRLKESFAQTIEEACRRQA